MIRLQDASISAEAEGVTQGSDGEIDIDSPNEITGTVIQLNPPLLATEGLLTQRCLPQLQADRSTLIVETIRSTRFAPEDPLASPLSVDLDHSTAASSSSNEVHPADDRQQLGAIRDQGSCFESREN